MPRKAAEQLTAAELELMEILWAHGPATVQAVVEKLPEERRLAYTTVQTTLGILHRKKKVRRVDANRAYTYEAAVTRDGAATNALREMVDRLFHGDPEKLVLAMVENEQLNKDHLESLRATFEQALEKKRGR